MASADALMDEVTLLEAALRQAVARRGNGTPDMAQSPATELQKEVIKEHVKLGMEARNLTSTVPSPTAPFFRERFDDAVASYGVQLRNWIDMQVDARLSVVLHGVLDGEFMALRQESGAALGAVQQAESEMQVLKGTQAKLLSVVEGISEELARTKAAVSAFQLGAQLDTAAKTRSREVEMDDTKSELKRWVEESQTRLSEDIMALQQRLMADLRNETTAAFRSEAAAVAALDEQLWLTDQRLGQRIDELAHSQRECITVIERRKGSSEQKRYDTEEVFREESDRRRVLKFADDSNGARGFRESGSRFRLGGVVSGSTRSAGNAITNSAEQEEPLLEEVQVTEAEAGDSGNASYEQVVEATDRNHVLRIKRTVVARDEGSLAMITDDAAETLIDNEVSGRPIDGEVTSLGSAMERITVRSERRPSDPSLRSHPEAHERHRIRVGSG
mmetsp:Transcript_94921/g.178580  ORF Transcript_94921/g.178580 Transcript_94921/m.178580 type:complete len:446 (-) Transcript_94921:43-1380(-)